MSANTPTILSEYLQARLREQKAESARSSRYSARNDRQPSLGRDDDILAFDNDTPTSRRAVALRYGTSPPTSFRQDLDTPSHRRQHSGASQSTPGSGRSMGARESEDHISRLSKENFNLKMEVYHRRVKAEELDSRCKSLEDKLVRLPKVEEDNEELIDVNEELVVELEKRDRAIDEAVVVIAELEQKASDLERKASDLERRLRDATGPDRAFSKRDEAAVSRKQAERRPQTPPAGGPKRESRRTTVSPQVSARLAQLALPNGNSEGPRQHVPSFLLENEPSTGALRGLFLDGHKIIRPIPSRTTLFSMSDQEGNIEDALKSPKFSVLSLSDLGETADLREEPVLRQASPAQENDTRYARQDEPHVDGEIDDIRRRMAYQRSLARTNRWINDSATQAKDTRTPRMTQGPEGGQFQSLIDVLHRERREAASLKRQRTSDVPVNTSVNANAKPIGGAERPSAASNPVFGQNLFPPTPDTMATRQLNRSTSSIVADKSSQDVGFQAPPYTHDPHVPSIRPTEYDLQSHAQFVAQSGSLQRGVESYDGHWEPDHLGNAPHHRSYSSDTNETDTPRSINQRVAASLAGTTMVDDGHRAYPPARSSPSPPRFFNSRRLPVEAPALATTENGRQLYRRQTSPARVPRREARDDRPTPISPVSARHYENPSLRVSVDSRQPASMVTSPVRADFGVKSPARPINVPTTPTKTTPSAAPSRRPSLRARMNKFTRRNSNATAPAPATEATSPPPVPRSNSITRHFQRFRRRSSAAAPLEPPKPPFRDAVPSHAHSQEEREAREDAYRNVSTAFVQAATAAAPFLSFDGYDKTKAASTVFDTLPSPPRRADLTRRPATGSASVSSGQASLGSAGSGGVRIAMMPGPGPVLGPRPLTGAGDGDAARPRTRGTSTARTTAGQRRGSSITRV